MYRGHFVAHTFKLYDQQVSSFTEAIYVAGQLPRMRCLPSLLDACCGIAVIIDALPSLSLMGPTSNACGFDLQTLTGCYWRFIVCTNACFCVFFLLSVAEGL